MFDKVGIQTRISGLECETLFELEKADSVTAKAALTSFSYTAPGALLLSQTQTGQELVF